MQGDHGDPGYLLPCLQSHVGHVCFVLHPPEVPQTISGQKGLTAAGSQPSAGNTPAAGWKSAVSEQGVSSISRGLQRLPRGTHMLCSISESSSGPRALVETLAREKTAPFSICATESFT